VLPHLPFAMRSIKGVNYRKEIEYRLVHQVLVYPIDKMR